MSKGSGPATPRTPADRRAGTRASVIKADRQRAGPHEPEPVAPAVPAPSPPVPSRGPSGRLPAPAGPGPGRAGGTDQRAAGPLYGARQVELILQELAELPTLSPVATRVMRLGSASDADFDEIIALIEADPSLSARLISMCRRASVGASAARTVTTVRRAVVLLGLEAVQAAVLSVQVYEMMRQDPSARERREDEREPAGGPVPGFDRVGFWTHSIGVACACELLAGSCRELRVRPEEAFVAGLVHDLGKLVLDWVLPRTYARVVQLAASRATSIAEAERALLGIDHHLVGKRLAEHWGLPHMYQDAMWLHGQPAGVLPPVPHRGLVSLVTLGDALCRGLHVGWSGSHESPPDPEALAVTMGLNPSRVRECATKIHEQVARRAKDLGLGEQGGADLVVRSIASANARLAELHAACRERATLSRRQSRVLDSIARFAAGTHRCASVNDALLAVAESFAELAPPPPPPPPPPAPAGVSKGSAPGAARRPASRPAAGPRPPMGPQGPVAVIFQPREGERWRLIRLADDGPGSIRAASVESAEPPRRADGSPMPLADLARGDALGATVSLIQWLSEHAPGHDASHQPDLRSLRFLTLVAPRGPAAVLLHDRALPNTPSARRLLDSARAVWTAAIAAAAQHEGARRLAEALAQTTRVLSDTQARLTEQQSMARLGELTAGAAHELNNPLAVISGRAQLLAARLHGPDADDARHIADAAQRLADLVTRLHAVASPPEPLPTPCDPAELLRRVAQRAGENPDSGSRIIVEDDADATPPPPAAMLDPELLSRALGELVGNGLQAAPQARVRLAVAERPDGGLEISVADDGPGMSAHALRHAFDPFFSHKPAGRRTGLGLALARALVQAHGGRIELDSTPGRGTTARIVLPDWRCPQAIHGQEGASTSPEPAGEATDAEQPDVLTRREGDAGSASSDESHPTSRGGAPRRAA